MSNPAIYYVLDKKHNVLPATMGEWSRFFSTQSRVVRKTVIGTSRVSTVFLGLDHNFLPNGLPVLFETMIFGGPYSDYQWRWHTWKEALAGHQVIVTILRAKGDLGQLSR